MSRKTPTSKERSASGRMGEAPWRALVEQAPSVIYTESAASHERLYISPQVEALTGFPPAKWMDKRDFWKERIHPDDRAMVIAEDDRTNQSGEPFWVEYRLLTRDKRTLWVREEALLFRDEAGNPLVWQGILRDITEQKLLDDEWRTTVAFLGMVNTSKDPRQLIRAATDFIQQISGCEAVGIRLRQENDYPYYETRGFPKEHILLENSLCLRNRNGHPILDDSGLPLLECMCGNVISGRFDPAKPFFTEKGSFWTNCTTELLATTTETDRQTRTRNRCNGEGYESVALIPLRVGGLRLGLLQFNDKRKGQFTARWISVWETLADYLAVALSKFQAEESLRAMSSRQEALLAAIPDIVMEVDDHKVYTWANPAGLAFFGKDVLGREAATYFEGEQDTYRTVEPLFDGDENTIYVESWQRRQDGAKRLLAWWCRALKDGQGRVSGALSTARDITEQRQAEEQLLSLNTELELRVEARTRELRQAQEKLVRQERLAALGQLAGSIAHELRNPLGVISNAAIYLKMVQPQAPAKVAEYIEIIQNETRTSEKIITDLLDFARHQAVKREAVAPVYLVQQTLERFPPARNIRLANQARRGLPLVFVDPLQAIQALGNLVVNACQAMPDGGELTIGARESGEMVEIAIGDSGPGIPPEQMERLFEPLFTTKTTGIGLGLAVSRKLAEANGGRIEVRSEMGRGCTFTLYLPTNEEAA